LSGTSPKCYEYGTIEESGENNQTSRASWSTVLATPTLTDGTDISLFNFTKGTDNWNPIPVLLEKEYPGLTTGNVPASDAQDLILVTAKSNRIYLSNVLKNTHVAVYAIDGSMIKSFSTGADVSFPVNKGLWIVKTSSGDNNVTTKVMVY
jgi:exo-poly-alpha-galacturonosidase